MHYQFLGQNICNSYQLNTEFTINNHNKLEMGIIVIGTQIVIGPQTISFWKQSMTILLTGSIMSFTVLARIGLTKHSHTPR